MNRWRRDDGLSPRQTLEKLLTTLRMLTKPWKRNDDARWWVEGSLLGQWSGPYEAAEIAAQIYLGIIEEQDKVIHGKSQKTYVVGEHRFLARWTRHSREQSRALIRGLTRIVKKRAREAQLSLENTVPTWSKMMLTEEERNAFELLELTPSASIVEVRQRHRALALQHHPDRGGSLKRMQEINRAFNIAHRVAQ